MMVVCVVCVCCVCMFVCVRACVSASVCVPVYAYVSVCLSVRLSLCLSLCLSFCLSLCLSVCVCAFAPVHLCACVCESVNIVCVCVRVCIYVCICICVHLLSKRKLRGQLMLLRMSECNRASICQNHDKLGSIQVRSNHSGLQQSNIYRWQVCKCHIVTVRYLLQYLHGYQQRLPRLQIYPECPVECSQ